MSSCGTNARCGVTSSSTSPTTTDGEPISRWARIRLCHGLSSRRRAVGSFKSRISAVCIIATNGAPPENRSAADRRRVGIGRPSASPPAAERHQNRRPRRIENSQGRACLSDARPRQRFSGGRSFLERQGVREVSGPHVGVSRSRAIGSFFRADGVSGRDRQPALKTDTQG